MCPRCCSGQDQSILKKLVHEQPIRLNAALPKIPQISTKRMVSAVVGEWLSVLQECQYRNELSHVFAAFFARRTSRFMRFV